MSIHCAKTAIVEGIGKSKQQVTEAVNRLREMGIIKLVEGKKLICIHTEYYLFTPFTSVPLVKTVKTHVSNHHTKRLQIVIMIFLVLNKSHTQATAKQISVVPLINPKNLQDVFASAYPSLNAIGRT